MNQNDYSSEKNQKKQRGYEQPWEDDRSNELMILSHGFASKMKVRRPIINKKIVWVQSNQIVQSGLTYMKDDNGEIVTISGTPILEFFELEKPEMVFVKAEFPVFDGMKMEEIDLPIDEIFGPELNVANLNESEAYLLREIHSAYAYITNLMVEFGEDYSLLLHQLFTLGQSVIATSKAKDAKMAELIKTRISKGEQQATYYEHQYDDNRRKRFGLF